MMDDFVYHLKSGYPFEVVTHCDYLEYFTITVMALPAPVRGRGIGTEFTERVCAEADRRGVIIVISPEGSTQEVTDRLIRWYHRLGFERNADLDVFPGTFIRFPIVNRPTSGGVKILTLDKHQIQSGRPSVFPRDLLSEAGRLIEHGGEVDGDLVPRHLRRAAGVSLLRCESEVVGVAVLKRPLETYRNAVFEKAVVSMIPKHWRYELGYVCIADAARGHGFARHLCRSVLECADGASVFATTRSDNDRMQRVLANVGFSRAGKAYASTRRDATINLFLRASATLPTG
jgi:ribosomal protein S18 acetylase RimI-like enzyme